jgi:5-methyltetrahydrofolate--homocysteine methyltransferase
VVDLGRDVPARVIVDRAEEVHADIIATSSLMSVTMPKQKDLEAAEERAMRVKLLIRRLQELTKGICPDCD